MAAEATSDAAEADAGASANTASSNQRDQASLTGQTTALDIGADERVETFGVTTTEINTMNLKRTADLHQTLDSDAIHRTRIQQGKMDSIENRGAEQTLSERQRMFNQELIERETTRRRAEDNHTLHLLTLGDVVAEAIADNVAKKVVDALSVKAAGDA